MRKQRQTHGEEVANVLTHGAGMLFGLTAIVVLMIAGIRTGDPWVIGSFAVYALCMTSSYVTSTFYHAASDPKRKCQLRRWDHSAIYRGYLYAIYLGGSPRRGFLGLGIIYYGLAGSGYRRMV